MIKHPYRADITGLLHQGENSVELVVTNLLINRMIDPEYPEILEDKIIPEWPYASGGLNRCREEKVFNWREREMIKEPFPSGIWGEVRIVGMN